MLHHRTIDPALRAQEIADREAERVWQDTGSWEKWFAHWKIVYQQVLSEFAGITQQLFL